MIANFITGSRIIFSLAMLTFPVFSAGFYFFYMLAGFTDMIDGTIARKLGTESKFGSNFDTIADIVFVASAAYKLFPEFKIPRVIWLLCCYTGRIFHFSMQFCRRELKNKRRKKCQEQETKRIYYSFQNRIIRSL